MQRKCPNKTFKGLNSFFPKRINVYWRYETFFLKTQSNRNAIQLLFKVQVSLDQSTSKNIRVFFYVHAFLRILQCFQWNFLTTDCLPFFFQTKGTFYQMILSPIISTEIRTHHFKQIQMAFHQR